MVFLLQQPEQTKTRMFIILIVVVISWIYTSVKLIRIDTLNMHSLLYVNYNAIKLFNIFQKVSTVQYLQSFGR